MTPLEAETLALARSYVGKLWEDKGPNESKWGEIERIQAFCGARPGDPWCAALVSWCILKSAVAVPPTFLRSAGALRLLARNPHLSIDRASAMSLLRQGTPLVFIMDMGGGKGHAGFAAGLLPGDLLLSLEGNTGPGPAAAAQDRDGDGMYERRDRRFEDVDGWLRIA